MKPRIITFYSYKGGTGRSMALANIACLLARSARRDRGVLMIDWDLEAPGLHRFFQPEPTGLSAPQLGLIDLFSSFAQALGTVDDDESEESVATTVSSRIALHSYITPTIHDGLYLISAGRFDQAYASRVAHFEWERFYERRPSLFRSFAALLSSHFDYVLIDSRTGLTDTSGICTMLLPDTLVLVFTPNRQSLEGGLSLVADALTYRRRSTDVRPLLVLPLVSRVETAEPELNDRWRRGGATVTGYQPAFEALFAESYDVSPCDLEEYFNEIKIQHVPRYAYGENIAVLLEDKADRLSVSRSYETFAERIIQGLAPWEPVLPLPSISPSSDLVVSTDQSPYRGRWSEMFWHHMVRERFGETLSYYRVTLGSARHQEAIKKQLLQLVHDKDLGGLSVFATAGAFDLIIKVWAHSTIANAFDRWILAYLLDVKAVDRFVVTTIGQEWYSSPRASDAIILNSLDLLTEEAITTVQRSQNPKLIGELIRRGLVIETGEQKGIPFFIALTLPADVSSIRLHETLRSITDLLSVSPDIRWPAVHAGFGFCSILIVGYVMEYFRISDFLSRLERHLPDCNGHALIGLQPHAVIDTREIGEATLRAFVGKNQYVAALIPELYTERSRKARDIGAFLARNEVQVSGLTNMERHLLRDYVIGCVREEEPLAAAAMFAYFAKLEGYLRKAAPLIIAQSADKHLGDLIKRPRQLSLGGLLEFYSRASPEIDRAFGHKRHQLVNLRNRIAHGTVTDDWRPALKVLLGNLPAIRKLVAFVEGISRTSFSDE